MKRQIKKGLREVLHTKQQRQRRGLTCPYCGGRLYVRVQLKTEKVDDYLVEVRKYVTVRCLKCKRRWKAVYGEDSPFDWYDLVAKIVDGIAKSEVGQ